MGLIIGAGYGSSPEIFVRSSYGGYFGITNFGVLIFLLASIEWENRGRLRERLNCLSGGVFLALANHKAIVLPMCLGIWELIKSYWVDQGGKGRLIRIVMHPAIVGFILGFLIFVVYGLLVNPEEFWKDHVRTHFVDRVFHYNPLGYTGYPSIPKLWIEFIAHTNFLLFPLACLALISLFPQTTFQANGKTLTVKTGAWLFWCLGMAIAFSFVDWRMTKHLMPLLIPFHLAPALWSLKGRANCLIVFFVFLVLVILNSWDIYSLHSSFTGFSISPSW
jgi:hypothetical protein